MARLLTLAAVALLVLPALPALPAAANLIDLSGPIQAGDFRAWRVRLDAAGQVELGGSYNGLATNQPVLPVFAAAVRDGVPFDASAIYAYDSQPSLTAVVRAAGQQQGVGEHNLQGGGWTTYELQPAEYLFVLATGPGDGSADAIFRVHTDATLLASEGGAAFWGRGLDASDTALDAFALGNGGTARHWQYSGHDFPLEVQGQLFGFIGYHFPTNAHWVDPDGNARSSFVVGGPGAWTASFPQELFSGPICGGGGCFPLTGDSREDPPFAIGADVTI